MTRKYGNDRRWLRGSGTGRGRRRLGGLVLALVGGVAFGGCYVVPAGYPVAGPAYVAPAPVVVAPAPVYVAPGYGYGYGWGWRRYGRW
jgi:hypothetical protein